jgi:hypothetical protein
MLKDRLKHTVETFLRQVQSVLPKESLPYDRTHGVVYDKDEAINCYTDEYLMACASAGDLKLLAMITSSSISPFNQWVTAEDYERMVEEREEMVHHALSSGFRNIPDPVRGTKGHIEMPASGTVSRTRAIGSEGAHCIVEAAQSASPHRPIVAVMCGPLTVLADAYLMDPSIADAVVVAWFGGSVNHMGDYNGIVDPWAAYIVLERFPMVQFPVKPRGRQFGDSPVVPKERLLELPDTPLRKWMIDKRHPNGAPGACDADAPPAISVMHPEYVLRMRKVVFSHWQPVNGRSIPAFKRAVRSRTWVVEEADRDAATREWWRALKNPKAYHPQTP